MTILAALAIALAVQAPGSDVAPVDPGDVAPVPPATLVRPVDAAPAIMRPFDPEEMVEATPAEIGIIVRDSFAGMDKNRSGYIEPDEAPVGVVRDGHVESPVFTRDELGNVTPTGEVNRVTVEQAQARFLAFADDNGDGKMDFIDNTMTARSGTIRGRALIENDDQLLTPGIFGRLQLFGGEYDALLIPDSAVISDQARKIVFTVNKDNVVQPKPIVLGPLVDGLRVVRSGLEPTDRVVLDGLANPMVRPGAKVVPQKSEIVAAK